jgi:hypothetical protein
MSIPLIIRQKREKASSLTSDKGLFRLRTVSARTSTNAWLVSNNHSCVCSAALTLHSQVEKEAWQNHACPPFRKGR